MMHLSITNLRQQKFTQIEIERLLQLRRKIWDQQIHQALAVRRHLEFIRWLVATGRISEDIL
jgi:hypothetical protein